MIRIGLVGEDPNDTSSVQALLLQKFKNRVQFFPLAKRIRGWQLDTKKIQSVLPIEFKSKKCKFIIYIRDLDGYKSETSKVEKRKNWFKTLDGLINNKGILLLNIWELEALILADIETFNKIFKTSIQYKGDPMVQKEPKEFLITKSKSSKRKYKEADCPEIFEKLQFALIQKNCSYFKEFITDFSKKLS